MATGEGPPPPIAQVLIDDHSIRQLEPIVGRWPWPRMVHAVLVDFLARGPATLVVYDVLFSESAKGTSDIGGTAWTGAESDAALVDSVGRAGNVILAAEASSEGLVDATKNVQPPLDDIPALQARWPVAGFAERRPLLTPPFPALARAARGIGHARLAYDADGPARRYVPFVEVAGRIVPSLPVAAVLAARGIAPDQVTASRMALMLGPTRVPWVEQVVPDYYGPPQTVWRGLVPFRGPTMRADRTPTFPSYSFQDVFLAEQQILAGQAPHLDPAVFKDRIVVVGVTAEGLKDIFTTPYGEGTMPGAEFHANVIDGLLANRAIAPAASWQRATAILVPALAVSAVGALAAPWAAALAALAAAVSLTWLTTRALGQGLWLPLVVPVLAALLAFVADLAWSYFVEGREKRRVKRLFSRYVSRDVYQRLLASPGDIGLGGERREMTVLFSDMRGFTTLSESGEAEDLVRQLNQYFTRMVRGRVRPAWHGGQVRRRHDHGPLRGAARRSRPCRSRGADRPADGRRPAGPQPPLGDRGPGRPRHRHRHQHRGDDCRQHRVRYDHELHGDWRQREPRRPARIAQQAVRHARPDFGGDPPAVEGTIRPPPPGRGPGEGEDPAGRHLRSAHRGEERGIRMRSRVILAAAVAAVVATPALTAADQLGGLTGALKKAQQFKDVEMTDAEEAQLGAQVSERIRARYGVVQSVPVHRYVSLVGMALATASAKPGLQWKFIVLDTDAVNAFAAPGGFIHITKGALANLKDESELAGVLGHEIIHVTEKHTIRAIQKGKLVQMGANDTVAGNNLLMSQLVDTAYQVIENGFGRGEELEADEKGIVLANTVGYAPQGLNGFLTMLMERNKSGADRNGLFASHPETKERVDKLTRQIAAPEAGLHGDGGRALYHQHHVQAGPGGRDRQRRGRIGRGRRRVVAAAEEEGPRRSRRNAHPGRRREEVGADHRIGRGPRRRQRGQERRGRHQHGAGRGHRRRRRAHRVQEGRRI